MTETAEITELIRCPRCKRDLFLVSDNQLECSGCANNFYIHPSVVPIFDLYIDDNSSETGRDLSKTWDKNAFERTYQRTGYHETGVGFDERQGYPEAVSKFYFERVKNRLLQWVSPGPDHTVLDIGCGAGYFLCMIRDRYLARGVDPAIVGIDISEAQLSYMAQRMEKEKIPALAIHASGEYLPFPDNSFDLITCSEVLEHIRNPERALREMRRVLKPSGLLLLSTPSMTAQKTWGLLIAPFAALVKLVTGYKPRPKGVVEGYEVPWYASEFRSAIKNAGFEIDDFEYNAIIPHFWHFRFLPKPLVNPVVRVCGLMDRYLKFLLKGLAQHFVVRARISKAPVGDLAESSR